MVPFLSFCGAVAAAGLVFSAAAEEPGGRLRERLRERLEQRDGGRTEALGERSQRSSKPSTGAPTWSDVAYGPDPLQRLDVYTKTPTGKAPVLVMVHGGGWKRGDKIQGAALQNKVPYYTGKGWVVVSINYRLTPDVTPLEQADDVAAALVHVQRHAATWGGDGDKVVLMGHSAGAHLVTLVTADARQRFASRAAPWLGTVSLDGAGVDIEASMRDGVSVRLLQNIYRDAFGNDPALWRAVSPMAQLRPGAYPMMMVCSTSRPDQPCGQTQAFVDKAQGLGVRASVLPVRLSHGEVNADVGLDNAMTRAIDRFLAGLGATP